MLCGGAGVRGQPRAASGAYWRPAVAVRGVESEQRDGAKPGGVGIVPV